MVYRLLWIPREQTGQITPNLKEINQVLAEPVHNEDGAVEVAAHYVMNRFNIRNVIVTRSEEGLSLIRDDENVHIPTKAQEVFDVSGAGDTVIAVFAMGLAGGMSPADSAYIANLAASVVVAKLGTYAVSREELMAVLKGEAEK